ncbi:hypothetical protein [Chitinophaga sp.]|uniref:hypothetical protein n=1 Tax=Chitinophaga sp. TaxID=1869181 RepID=UPI0031D147B5
MKQHHFCLLMIALTLFACNYPTTIKHPVNAVKRSALTTPEKHEPVVVLYEKADSNIVFLEDNTRLGKLGFYCYSDLSTVEKTGTPAWIKDLTQIPEGKPLLLLNAHPVKLSHKIEDLSILMPTYIQTFEMQHQLYLMISLNLVSFTSASGWAHILLKVDAAGNVVKDNYFETAEMMEAAALKDADGDGEPDFKER